MYKLIATDCDGTILNSKGYLPKEIIDTFKVLPFGFVRKTFLPTIFRVNVRWSISTNTDSQNNLISFHD